MSIHFVIISASMFITQRKWQTLPRWGRISLCCDRRGRRICFLTMPFDYIYIYTNSHVTDVYVHCIETQASNQGATGPVQKKACLLNVSVYAYITLSNMHSA